MVFIGQNLSEKIVILFLADVREGILSKVTEKLVYNRLSSYLTDHSVLHANQFGFREKLSTSMALLELVDKLSEATDNKLISIGVFIDLAKAFDTVKSY